MKHFSFLSLIFAFAILANAQTNLPTRKIGGNDFYYRQIQKGESLYSIANELGISSETILKYNPFAEDGLKAGQCLYFPVSDFKPKQAHKASTEHNHIVEKGETIYGISKTYGITTEDLITANPQLSTGLKAGDTIIIPIKDCSQVPKNGTLYTIKKGDNPYRVALNHNISTEALLAANPGISATNFKTGETIIIPAAEKKQIKEEQKPSTVFISKSAERGETFESLASKHGVDVEHIKDANPNIDKVKKGTTISIPISQTKDSTEAETAQISTLDTVITEQAKSVVPKNITLIMPLNVDKHEINVKSKLYCDFYGGFLLGLKENASDDISLNVNLIDSATDSISDILEKDEVIKSDIIIPACDEKSLDEFFQFGRKNDIDIFNAFSIKDDSYFNNDRACQLNIPSSNMYDAVKSYIADNYTNYQVIFIAKDSIDNSTKQLVELIKELDIQQQTLTVDELAKDNFINLVRNDKKILFVPTTGSTALLKNIRPHLETILEECPEYDFRLCGYPEWINLGSSYKKFFHKANTFFYSRYAPENREIATINKDFEQWFSRESVKSLPQMDAFGYDIANFIVQIIKHQNKEFDFEGTHCCINLKRSSNWGGYFNSAVYIIEFNNDNTTNKFIIK